MTLAQNKFSSRPVLTAGERLIIVSDAYVSYLHHIELRRRRDSHRNVVDALGKQWNSYTKVSPKKASANETFII